jgi:hypothetical protein
VFEVGVKVVRAPIRGLWDKDDHEREGCSKEDGHKIKAPLPAHGFRNSSSENWSQKGRAEEGDVGHGHSFSSFLDAVS